MATLTVYDASGSEVGRVDVDPEAIAPKISKQLLHDAVVMYEANLRQGSHNTRTRGQVSGTTKKMYRQKGTGNARAGSKRTNVRRGGGVARTVKPRDYSYRLPKKAVRLATRMSIASKLVDGQVVVIDKLDFAQPATKQMAATLAALGLEGQTTLVATSDLDASVYRSARNIPGVDVLPVKDLNALSVLRPRRMLVTRDAIEKIVDGSFAASGPVTEAAS